MDNRQKELLKEIVESYIKNVKPVGSQMLCKKFKLSSATIRNEMAALEKLGYNVEPKYNEPRADIVQNIIFNDEEKLIKYVQGIQFGSPIDGKSRPIPWEMPGYEDQVIMASGSFTQGSSIEISCDGPIRPPYIAYQQGGLTYEYGFLGIAKAIEELKK